MEFTVTGSEQEMASVSNNIGAAFLPVFHVNLNAADVASPYLEA
jgi:hypothetical protein